MFKTIDKKKFIMFLVQISYDSQLKTLMNDDNFNRASLSDYVIHKTNNIFGIGNITTGLQNYLCSYIERNFKQICDSNFLKGYTPLMDDCSDYDIPHIDEIRMLNNTDYMARSIFIEMVDILFILCVRPENLKKEIDEYFEYIYHPLNSNDYYKAVKYTITDYTILYPIVLNDNYEPTKKDNDTIIEFLTKIVDNSNLLKAIDASNKTGIICDIDYYACNFILKGVDLNNIRDILLKISSK